MNIGEAASSSGVSAKAIRYYESISLISPATRANNGYRDFSEQDVHYLRFINRARSLGFSVAGVGELLALYQDRKRASADVKSIAILAIDRIDEKMAELQEMRAVLSVMSEYCHGDDRPDCPILDGLAAFGQDEQIAMAD
jgi:MerR family copper efflux transcriptional regulator